MTSPNQNQSFLGIALAILAVIVWSGNFIVSRGVSSEIGPVSLAFYRWLTATIIITPIAWKKFRAEREVTKRSFKYLCWVSLTGIALFNTCVYVAGHYTTAINLALIGTTSSPIFATVLAAIFLQDKPGRFRIAGIIVCIVGILLLLSKGNWQTLINFHFSKGDLWVLAGAFAFAIYNVLVRKKPVEMSALNFLFVIFALGTVMLFPFYIAELSWGDPVHWTWGLAGIILYLGAGTSVIAFLCWNIALHKLGAGRTVLFGNLIPVFSTLEAVWLLDEKITSIHIASGIIVIAGLVLANAKASLSNTINKN